MSWQATNWAMNQKVGNAGRKLLLVALANYADENGVCWPSQGRLALDTEASLDTIQRQTKKLVADGFVSIERPPKRRGQWQTFIYRLNMPAQNARPQNAARSESSDQAEGCEPATAHPYLDGPAIGTTVPKSVGTPMPKAAWPGRTQPDSRPQGQAAPSPTPGRTAMRLKPSKEYSIEQSGEPPQQQPRAQTKFDAAARRQAWQMNRAVEVVQDRIARRLGKQGWSILVELDQAELDRLTRLEQSGQLDDETLAHALFQHDALLSLPDHPS
jgi:Helix-turn-helix domain